MQAVDPEGEVAVARAAAARGVAMGLSSFASKPVEAVVAANPSRFFQVYWAGTREQIRGRARADVLQRLRRVDADTTALLGRPALAARTAGRAADSALLGLGKNSIHELGPADLLVPEGFLRRLGVAGELVN